MVLLYLAKIGQRLLMQAGIASRQNRAIPLQANRRPLPVCYHRTGGLHYRDKCHNIMRGKLILYHQIKMTSSQKRIIITIPAIMGGAARRA